MSRPDRLGWRAQWNVANAVTVARIVLVPVFLVLLLQDGGHSTGWRWAAFVLFGLAASTDRLDGWLARSRGLVTDLGKLLDPIADKALMGAALVALSALGDLPWWVTIVILVREVGITVMRFVVIDQAVIPASRGGKLKTVVQTVAIGLFVAPLDTLPDPVTWIAWGFMLLAVVLTVVTGVDYLVGMRRLRRESRAA
ncbi:CDP-diacylglycerol--glycerol-3-phosphate 3-phosphatidyltransferase [Luteimicrobium subarcticum]|uniref:CDP-diacylglycerol--glycerol-3-phosphate 3-phosphatidyltransferase n=1 Tax=Luteimicrobium subarcticum TaxID=620910 RepID=A0A2M8WU54_9MICO|nr:CDP-diacylglycerol--glycerol-3-phosphate 3-phosphatidyltransferase [Luteimicrobium subarcticum]PJI94386.1 CDP-diacylglycerol--glycerol-3-phosphate 3-phosphatidyltransferase [Luteimicrobium subarcticum]